MRSAKPKLLFLSLLLGGILLCSPAFAVDEVQLKNDLNEIKSRLAALEERQKEIIAKEDQILKELDIVKIWVHRK
ncbi:MAG: hypothetical protein WCJ71_05835 [Candidatus Omnitrophota bacterium]